MGGGIRDDTRRLDMAEMDLRAYQLRWTVMGDTGARATDGYGIRHSILEIDARDGKLGLHS